MAYFIIASLLTIALGISSLIGVIEYFRKGKEKHLVSLILLLCLYQLGLYIGRFEYLFTSGIVKTALFLVLGTLIFLIIKKKFYPSVLLLLLLGTIFIVKPVVQFLVEDEIRLIALEKYGVEPHHLDIDWERDCRYSHALVIKDGKEYHWSFKANAFID